MRGVVAVATAAAAGAGGVGVALGSDGEDAGVVKGEVDVCLVVGEAKGGREGDGERVKVMGGGLK